MTSHRGMRAGDEAVKIFLDRKPGIFERSVAVAVHVAEFVFSARAAVGLLRDPVVRQRDDGHSQA